MSFKREDELLAIVNSPRRGPRRGLVWLVVALIVLGAVVGGAVAFVARNDVPLALPSLPALPQLPSLPFTGPSEEDQLASLATEFAGALILNDDARAVRLTAAGAPADTATGQLPDEVAERIAEHRDTFQLLRADLAAEGCDWAAAYPLAFGGVLAEAEASTGGAPAEPVAVGYLYLVSGPRVYAVELSARQTGDAFRVVDVWNWQAVSVPPTAVRAHAMARVDAFNQEEATGGRIALNHVEPVYVELGPAEDG